MLRAASLLLLAALLLTLTYLLAPHWDPARPAVSLALVVTFCGGWLAGVAGAARVFNPETTS